MSKNKYFKKTNISNGRTIYKLIPMEGRRYITLQESDIDRMTDNEIRDLLISISQDNNEFYNLYYSHNTPIMKIKHRTFFDLLKKILKISDNN